MDGGGGRNRTGVHGFAGRCITTLPPRRTHEARLNEFILRSNRLNATAKFKTYGVETKRGKLMLPPVFGAGKEVRTPDPNLGKVVLYR